MNRKGFAIISIIISLITTAGGLYVTDLVMKAQLGIGLKDLFNFFLEIDQTMENAPLLGVGLGLEPGLYNTLEAERGNLTSLFNLGVDNLDVINSEPEVTAVLNAIFEDDYNIYLFTVFNNSFKVFDWSIGFSNGSIVRFELGMVGEYDVRVQLDHSIFSNLMNGDVSPEMIKDLVKDKQLKVNPILEVARVTKALPEIIRIVQEQT